MPELLSRDQIPALDAETLPREEGQRLPSGAESFGAPAPAHEPPRLRWRLSLVLFLATCVSTFLIGGPFYALGIMTILSAHEMGHYLQARRYRVPASLPYFIPIPLPPLGTMGAIIAMRSRTADSRALFDLAITGPLAGLVPAITLSAIGLKLSAVESLEATAQEGFLTLGEPVVFKLLSYLILGPLDESTTVVLHPIAFAGWVGIFITALNLLPIGQLDGGHILYTILPKKAHAISTVFYYAAIVAIVAGGLWHWSLLIVILYFLGVRHPPVAEGSLPLDRRRIALGWVTLLFVFLGFTPTPWHL